MLVMSINKFNYFCLIFLIKKLYVFILFELLIGSIKIYIEMAYGTCTSTDATVLVHRISNSKVQITDPNHWIWSPYWNILGDQILHFFEFFYYFFGFIKNCHIGWIRNNYINEFVTSIKNSKKIQKNVKFGLQG